MKTTAKFITLILIALSLSSFASAPKEESVKVIESKHKNVFVFKVDKALKGADVAVYSSTGDLVTSQTLSTRKIKIDFRDVKFGTYTIQVKKGGELQELNYEKKLILSDMIR